MPGWPGARPSRPGFRVRFFRRPACSKVSSNVFKKTPSAELCRDLADLPRKRRDEDRSGGAGRAASRTEAARRSTTECPTNQGNTISRRAGSKTVYPPHLRIGKAWFHVTIILIQAVGHKACSTEKVRLVPPLQSAAVRMATMKSNRPHRQHGSVVEIGPPKSEPHWEVLNFYFSFCRLPGRILRASPVCPRRCIGVSRIQGRFHPPTLRTSRAQWPNAPASIRIPKPDGQSKDVKRKQPTLRLDRLSEP